MIKEREKTELWTLAQIQELTGYATTISTYQALRNKGVRKAADRPNPAKVGGPINLYDPDEVMAALGERIERHRLRRISLNRTSPEK